MNEKTIRVRRVGSVTFGILLVLCGITGLLHLVFPALDYEVVYRFWPVVLILLGIEVLAGTRHKTYQIVAENGEVKEECAVKYDFPAILLTMAATFFIMCMALVQWCYEHSMVHVSI